MRHNSAILKSKFTLLILRRFPDFEQALEERRHFLQRDHVRSIAERAVGMRMGFEKNAIRAGSEGGTRQHRSQLALAARFISASSRELNGMRGIEDHRKPKPAHHRDG